MREPVDQIEGRVRKRGDEPVTSPSSLVTRHPSLDAAASELADRGLIARRDEPMSRHTSFRLGGAADLYVLVHSLEELEAAAMATWEHDVPLLVYGRGSNLLVADRGIRGLVVENQAERITIGGPIMIERDGQVKACVEVTAESGTRLPTLAVHLARQGLAGLEWATAIPGSVGGGVVQNAGAYGGDMSEALVSILVLRRDGSRVEYRVDELDLGYRHSRFRSGGRAGPDELILSARFAVWPEPADAILARSIELNRRRRAAQPPGASAGSIFKNPPGDYAGRLVEQAGLKGFRIGGAQISPKHANFIVNNADATAKDVRRLIETAQARVLAQTDLRLEPEVEMVGDWE